VILLAQKGHAVYPVNPALGEIKGQRVYKRLGEIPEPLHTITLYVSPALSTGLADELLAAKPARVIFNPGTENPELEAKLGAAGIAVIRACTLVLLRTGRFEN
jgi:hypothetical protein